MAAEPETSRGRRPPWELLSLLGLLALYLFPAIKTGYYAEDLIHSMTPGIARVNGVSILGQFVEAVKYNLAVGRFYPVNQVLHIAVHGLARDVLVYKTVLVVGTISNMLLFYLLIRRLTGSRGFAGLASCLTVGLFQFRIHPDPLLGYYLQIQVVAAGLFFSLDALLLYLEGRGRAWLAASAAAYLLIALTYEITYPFFLLHLLLIWRGASSWKSRIVAALPILGVIFACGVTTWVFRRLSVTQDYYVHKVDFNAVAYLTAVWHMVSATLPMTYLLGDPHSVFRGLRGVSGYGLWALKPMAVVVALASMGVSLRSLRRPVDGADRSRGWMAATVGLGLLMVVLPTLLVASSPYHQAQFHFGVGWGLPGYIECYGMGLVLATFFWWAISLRPLGGPFATWKCAGVAGLVALVTGVTYRANQEVATCLNAPWGTRNYREVSSLHGGYSDQNRRLLESALLAGLMETVPERSVVHLSHEYAIWHAPIENLYFYAAYASKVLVTEVPAAQDPASPCREIFLRFLREHSITPRAGHPYQLRDVCLNRKSGYVVLWQAESEEGEPRLFVRHPQLFQDKASPAFRVVVDGGAVEGAQGPGSIDRPGKELTVIRSGRDWGLYSLRAGPRPVAPEAVRVVFNIR